LLLLLLEQILTIEEGKVGGYLKGTIVMEGRGRSNEVDFV
jgi:hypothetical protein